MKVTIDPYGSFIFKLNRNTFGYKNQTLTSSFFLQKNQKVSTQIRVFFPF